MKKNSDTDKKKPLDSVKIAVTDHIKIKDKTTGKGLLNKRG